MRRASGMASSVAVITSSCPGASPSPAPTATSAKRSSFCSNSGVWMRDPSANAAVQVMAIIITWRHGALTMRGEGHSGMDTQTDLVLFVYGTLKRGCRSHGRLSGSPFIGVAWTKPLYRLYDCGAYPGLVLSRDGESVGGELYRVNSAVIA